MNDFDELLRQSRPTPRRDWAPDFTAQITAELRAHPDAPRKEPLMKRVFAHPIALTFAVLAVIMISGTTYALTDGFTKAPDLNRIFGYLQTPEASGDRVLTIKTTDCSTIKTVDKPGATSDQILYYRLNRDSKISNDDFLKYVQFQCEYGIHATSSAGDPHIEAGMAKYNFASLREFDTAIQRVTLCQQDSSKFCDYVEGSKSSTDPADSTAQKARDFVAKAYDEYTPVAGTDSGKQLFKQYVTPAVATSIDRPSAADTVTCSQGEVTISYGAARRLDSGSYLIPVTGQFDGGKPFDLVDVTYDPSAGKISAISCPMYLSR